MTRVRPSPVATGQVHSDGAALGSRWAFSPQVTAHEVSLAQAQSTRCPWHRHSCDAAESGAELENRVLARAGIEAPGKAIQG